MKLFYKIIIAFILVAVGVYSYKFAIQSSRLNNCIIVLEKTNDILKRKLDAKAQNLELSFENIPLETLVTILHKNHDASGESSETYLIDDQYRTLTDSRFDQYIAKGDKIVTPSTMLALEGKSGYMEEVDMHGISVLSVFSFLRYGQRTFAIVTQVDIAEAKSSKFNNLNDFYKSEGK